MTTNVSDIRSKMTLAEPAPAPAPRAGTKGERLFTAAHQELLALAARGAPMAEALNAVVRAAGQVRQQETRAAIFIFDPATVTLRYAASEGLDEGYTSKIDHFPVGPTQPSCGKAAYIGHDVIVGDVATDSAWAPYRALADEHGIRACWSFLLRGPNNTVLGTFALYHRIPCEPDSDDYEEVRYFADIATLMIARHLDADARRREQQATEEALRAANRHKDAFLATLAHELRNPLGGIKHGLAIIRLAGEQAVARERALLGAERQMKQMEWLIEDLLDANRVTRGDLTLRRQHMDLKPALDLAYETVAPLCASRRQALTVTMPALPVFLDADAVRVTQMLTNLLNNACKFTPEGGRVFLDVETGDGIARIRVRDEGRGIAARDLAGIFEMFAQVDDGQEGGHGSPGGNGGNGGNGGQGGLGIGLALVRSLATMHGGRVDAYSAGLGKGAEFVLQLPLSTGLHSA